MTDISTDNIKEQPKENHPGSDHHASDEYPANIEPDAAEHPIPDQSSTPDSAAASDSAAAPDSSSSNTESATEGPSAPTASGAYVVIDDRPLTEQELNQEDHDILPDYKVGEKLGRGGCAVVFEGWRKSDNFHVAIKQLALAPTLEEDEQRIARKRFYREAKLIASLHESHIVQCVDYGVMDGQPCMVLEFIKGQELGEYMKVLHDSLGYEGLPLEDAIDVTIQVLKALEVSHNMTVIHRDIKPGNIMVLDDDINGNIRIKVLDFGIATVLDNVENNNTLMTQQGNIRGTPAYMAPELFTGAVRASVESDLYAVGLVLLECLTNKVAFEGSSFMEVAYKQVNEDPEIPGFIPECIAKIIQKACSKRNADRYHSARDFINDLEANTEQAIKTYPKCLSDYAKSNGKTRTQLKSIWKNSKKLIFMIAGVILLIGLIGAVAYITLLLNSNEEDSISNEALLAQAELEKEQALQDKEKENRAAREAAAQSEEAIRRELAERERQTFLIGRDYASEKIQTAWIATIKDSKDFFVNTTPPKPKNNNTNKNKNGNKSTTRKVSKDPFIDMLQTSKPKN